MKNKRILVTGASFIGSHLIEKLIILKPSHIRIVNKTTKHRRYFTHLLKDIEFIASDLRNLDKAHKVTNNIDVVFHLAADHGGRGYLDNNQGNTTSNLVLDGSVFLASLRAHVEKLFYASSACVYPHYLQSNPNRHVYLEENAVKPPYDADNMYGWAKLMGELTLKAYHKDYGLKSAIGRFFTVYGERASETHAVIATIAKAYIKQDPFQIWGTGKQIRNWTYVTDIVDGIIRSTQKIDDATAINFGTMERVSVKDMARLIFREVNFYPKKINFVKMPTGPLNRVADNALAYKLLGWKPATIFKRGLKKTIRWYYDSHDQKDVQLNLDKLLLEA